MRRPPAWIVAAHKTATATFQVTPTSSASGGTEQLTATARYVVAGAGAGKVSGSASVNVPYASLSAAFNTVGVTDNSDQAAGNFDGSGYSYSAQSLAAIGITSGSVDGTTSTGTITLSDWYSNAAVTGDSLVTTTAHWNAPSSQADHQVSLYLSAVPLGAGMTVA